MRHRYEIYDTVLKQPYKREPYKYRHNCNRACDQLNGNIIKQADAYRSATRGV